MFSTLEHYTEAAMIILYKLESNKQNNYWFKTNTQTTRLGMCVGARCVFG